MAEPTTNRLALRRAIGRTARMKFYLRYPDGSLDFSSDGGASTDDVNSTEAFYCDKLAQGEGAWNNAYIYVTSTDDSIDGFERRIANFNADANAMFLDWPADTDEVPSSDDSFELLSIWPPSQVHDAINDSIRDAWRTYPDIVTDESLVIQEDRREYDISGLEDVPYRMLQIYVERSVSNIDGQMTNIVPSTAVSSDIFDGFDSDDSFSEDIFSTDVLGATIFAAGISATDVFGDTTMDLGELTASTSTIGDWRFGIYTGTGAGSLYVVSGADTSLQLLSATSTASTAPNPDTTSKFTLWNQAEQDVNWYRILPVRFDTVEHPNKMYIQGDLETSEGMRMRLVYLAQPVTLDADSDETTVPRYFLINKSLAHLHDSLVNDNRADRRDHSAIAEHHDQLARSFESQNPRRMPAGTVWQEVRGGTSGRSQIDPLGWNR